MYTKTRYNSILFVIAVLAAVALVSSACSFNDTGVRTYSPVVNVTILQDELDQSSPTFTVHSNGPYDHLLDVVTRVELHDGFIRYVGTKFQPDGSEEEGSFDLSLGAEDDRLKARIVAVNIPGVDLDDPSIDEINRELEEELTRQVTDQQGEVLFKEVVVREGVLKIKVQVNISL